MNNIYYTAYFVDNTQDLINMFETKHEVIYAHHSTNKYKPDNLNNVEVGKKIKLKIIGRATDDLCDVLGIIPNLRGLFCHFYLDIYS